MEKSFKRLPKRAEYYVVIYDVFSGADRSPRWSSGADWRRARIARILLEIGVRTQKSVFEINVSDTTLKKLISLLEKIANTERDKVYVYPVESKVKRKLKRIGYVTPLLRSIFI